MDINQALAFIDEGLAKSKEDREWHNLAFAAVRVVIDAANQVKKLEDDLSLAGKTIATYVTRIGELEKELKMSKQGDVIHVPDPQLSEQDAKPAN